MSKKAIIMDPTLGEIAYSTYAEDLDWLAENGEKLPPYNHLSARLQDAWEAAAEAVTDYMEKNG